MADESKTQTESHPLKKRELLDLPAELRREIFEHCIEIDEEDSRFYPGSFLTKSKTLVWRLAATCREIRQHVFDILCGNEVWVSLYVPQEEGYKKKLGVLREERSAYCQPYLPLKNVAERLPLARKIFEEDVRELRVLVDVANIQPSAEYPDLLFHYKKDNFEKFALWLRGLNNYTGASSDITVQFSGKHARWNNIAISLDRARDTNEVKSIGYEPKGEYFERKAAIEERLPNDTELRMMELDIMRAEWAYDHHAKDVAFYGYKNLFDGRTSNITHMVELRKEALSRSFTLLVEMSTTPYSEEQCSFLTKETASIMKRPLFQRIRCAETRFAHSQVFKQLAMMYLDLDPLQEKGKFTRYVIHLIHALYLLERPGGRTRSEKRPYAGYESEYESLKKILVDFEIDYDAYIIDEKDKARQQRAEERARILHR